jgi:hypothetical protein
MDQALLFVYRMLLGDADPDAFNIFKRSYETPSTYLLWMIFFISTVVMMIILLNVIIAIMG